MQVLGEYLEEINWVHGALEVWGGVHPTVKLAPLAPGGCVFMGFFFQNLCLITCCAVWKPASVCTLTEVGAAVKDFQWEVKVEMAKGELV